MADQYDGPVMRAYEPTLAEQMKQFLFGDSRPSPERRRFAEGMVDYIPGLSLQQAKRDAEAGQYKSAFFNTLGGAGPFVPSAMRMARGTRLAPRTNAPREAYTPASAAEREAHLGKIVQGAASGTKQARQDAAVQAAIDAAVKRSRTASPAQMSPAETAEMQRRFYQANPQYVPANARNMGVQEVRAAQDAFAGPNAQALVRPVDISELLGEARVSPVQTRQTPPARQAAAPMEAPSAQAPAVAAPAPAPSRPRDVLQVSGAVDANAVAAQQAALNRANAASSTATAPSAQPWGAQRPSSGLPPGSKVVPPRAPMSDPLKTKFPLSTEAQLYAAPVVAIGAGEILNQTGNAETMYPEFFGPGKRAQQAAINAAMERQRIDEMDEKGIGVSRPIPSDIAGSADFDVPRLNRVDSSYAPDFENFSAWARGPVSAPAVAVAPRYTDVPVGELDPKYAATVAAAKRQVAPGGGAPPAGGKASFNKGQPIDLTSGPSKAPSGGFLSGLFTNRPATTRQLFQQSVDNPDDAGAWMRAERQYAATHKDNPNFNLTKLDESGMARGGAANASPTKEALLHKSLEIIHHMIRSR